jgi:xylulokinase
MPQHQEKTILSVDIGTSSLKAAIIDLEGRELAFSRKVYPDGPVSALDWEEALIAALGQLFKGIGSGQLAAICISGNGPTLVPVDSDGAALAPLHWYDALARIGKQGERANGEGRSLFLPHAAWFLLNRPADYEQTQYLFPAQDWLAFRLGAEPVSSLPAPAYAPYYWDQGQCRRLGLDMGKFPPMVKMGSVIGKVPADQGLGIPAGIPIVAGGPDFVMALIGVQAITPGIACDRAGTSEGINLCTAAPIEGGDLRVLPHIQDGLWNISGIIPSSGRLFEQYRSLSGQSGRDYGDLLRELIPDYDGEHGRLELPDDLAALLASGKPLPAPHEPVGRGTLELMASMVREVLARFARQGLVIQELRVSGGQGKSPLWNRLKADLTGVTLLIPEVHDGELAGDAVLGAIALGECSSLSEACGRMIRMKDRYPPQRPTIRIFV